MATQLKHRWSVSHNYLAGITAGDWLRLLRENGFAVDPVYWHRAAFVTALSALNSVYRWREERRFGAAIEEIQIEEAPLFILGHWRSGTTHLHNLFALDTDQFAYANTYQVVNPHTFLTTEDLNSKLFASFVPAKRLMDNMALSFQSAQEDEFAMLLSCFRSLYLGVTFPRKEEHYEKYLSFRDATRTEIEEWISALRFFVKKLTLKYGRAVILKSPPHTARIRLILEAFPEARFVHIHRDPYVVFQSSRHYFDTAMWYTYLQRPDVERIDEAILRRYNVMFDAFFEDRELIPENQFCELSFDALEKDPAGQMGRIYETLGIPGFAALEPKLKEYLASIADYKKNSFAPLPADTRDIVAKAWSRGFEAWGYPK